MRKDKPDNGLVVKIVTIDELKKSSFKVGSRSGIGKNKRKILQKPD